MPDTNGPSGPPPTVQELDNEDYSVIPTVGKCFMKHSMHAEGELVEVPGLGSIPNGGSKEINLVQAKMYEDATGEKWPIKDNKPQDLVIEVLSEEEQAKRDAEAERKATSGPVESLSDKDRSDAVTNGGDK